MTDIISLYTESTLTGILQEAFETEQETLNVLFFSKNNPEDIRTPQATELRLTIDLGKENQEEVLFEVQEVLESGITVLKVLKRNLPKIGDEQTEGEAMYHSQNAHIDSVANHWAGNVLEKLLKGEIDITGNDWKIGDGSNDDKVITGIFEDGEKALLKFTPEGEAMVWSGGGFVKITELASHGDTALIKQHADVDTAVSDEQVRGDVLVVDENGKWNRLPKGEKGDVLMSTDDGVEWKGGAGVWDERVMMRDATKQFTYWHSDQYLQGAVLYDRKKKVKWSLSGKVDNGGGFINENTVLYSTSSGVKKSVLGDDGSVDTEDVAVPDFSTAHTKKMFVNKGNVFFNDNAGASPENILGLGSTITATYNASTERIRYDVISGDDIDFAEKVNVGQVVTVSSSVNSLNNRSRTVTDRGLNFLELSAGKVWRSRDYTASNVSRSNSQVNGDLKTGASVNFGAVSVGGNSSYSYSTGLTTNLVAGERVRTYASASGGFYFNQVKLQGYSGGNVTLYDKQNNIYNTVYTPTVSDSNVSFSALFGYNSSGGPGVASARIVIEHRVDTAGTEQATNSRQMIVGANADLTIRAFSLDGNILEHREENDVLLPFSLSGYCDYFGIADDGVVKMVNTAGNIAQYNPNDDEEETKLKYTPLPFYLAYITEQDTMKTVEYSTAGNFIDTFTL